MFNQPQTESLSFKGVLDAVNRGRDRQEGFPYSRDVCRCAYCRYCLKGQCVLKDCCCIKERAKARSCTFRELLDDCFFNIKDHLFRSKLKLVIDRAGVLASCFQNRQHRDRFQKAVATIRRTDYRMLAQLYVLTADENLWEKAVSFVGKKSVDYSSVSFHDISSNGYLFYCLGYDIENGTSHTDLCDIVNDEIVCFDAFYVICCSLVICRYGMDAIKIAERRRNRRRRKAAHGR